MDREAWEPFLRRCIDLAAEALTLGDQPFASVLVGPDGDVLAEERNRVGGGDRTQHPEFALARWAATNVDPDVRPDTTVFTSGEHCPMCSSAHAWAGLGRIVYISSAAQFSRWCAELGVGPSPVRPLSINDVAPGIPVEGPVEDLVPEIYQLHRSYFAT